MTLRLIILLFFSLFQSAQAQNTALNYGRLTGNDWTSIMRGNQPLMTKRTANTELRGTPFVYDTYNKGAIIVSDSLQSDNESAFKLNAADNEIWILQKTKDELVLIDKRITGLDLIVNNETHSFRKIVLPDVKNNPSRFVEILFKGNHFMLIKHIEKTFEAANAVDKGVGMVGRNYDAYLTATHYYILNHKNIYKRVALRKGDLYKVNPPLIDKNRDAITKFCKDNQISNPLEEADAIELMEYLDKLE